MPIWSLGWVLACANTNSQDSPPLPDEQVEEDAPCVDTFPVHVVPEMPTDYETPLPIREDALPELLSETGLYTAQGEIHQALIAFTPRWPLWSDGADKARWVYIPECSPIDSSDADNWELPVGTRLWKEFSVDGQRVETRLMERLGPRRQDWAYASYLWNEDGTQARKVGIEGQPQALGTSHDIPSRAECQECHGPASKGGGRPSRTLGFTAIQLDHSDTETDLNALAWRLSEPLESDPLTGPDTTIQALGVLHANCGSCHNPSRDGLPQSDLDLSLVWGQPLEQAGIFSTALDQPTQLFSTPSVQHRILSGAPHASAVISRMESRGNSAQMPPIGTHQVDEQGTAAVRAWIESL
ncbi:MAG: mono/diheme cytochrome c family protein [Cognaticolwellia sp.]|jgi:mono/diheme cytochrome c family protein